MRRSLIPFAALAVLAAACSSPQEPSAPLADPVQLAPIEAGAEPVATVVDRVLPAVVNVTTDVFRADPSGGTEQGQGVGTGFIVRSDGVIVTNCHVVEGAHGSRSPHPRLSRSAIRRG